jgi:glycerol-3-phosphate cytidylyltransferase
MIVYTGGTFDLFHYGHVNFLKRCSTIGSVAVALNTDEFIEEYKGFKPTYSYKQRESMLRACRYVDGVVPHSGYDSKPTILSVKPHVVAIGTDWAKKDYYKQMGFTQEWLDDNWITLVYIPYTDGISSTRLREGL